MTKSTLERAKITLVWTFHRPLCVLVLFTLLSTAQFESVQFESISSIQRRAIWVDPLKSRWYQNPIWPVFHVL